MPDLSPTIAPLVARLAANLADLEFDLTVLTRARRGIAGHNGQWWYRIALLNRANNEGACLEWWEMVPPTGDPHVPQSGVWLTFFLYAEPDGYASSECRLADAGLSDEGRWTYEAHLDAAMVAGLLNSFRNEYRTANSRPYPFSSTSELVEMIRVDTNWKLKSSLSESTTLDKTGHWYVPTWRAAFKAEFMGKWRGGPSAPAGRGFAVIVAGDGKRKTASSATQAVIVSGRP